jgi:tetratricopeptide (TPR) repeat protein
MGLFDWAEKEFRKLIQESAPGSQEDVLSRLVLSEMLHDLQRELAAAESLLGLVEAMDKDETVKQSVERMRDDAEGVYARMHYFYSEHYREQKDSKKQLEHLDKAAAYDAKDADVLIALYRLPNQDKARERKTLAMIQDATTEFQTEIETFRRAIESARNESEENGTERQLAVSCNQFAWLVGNTIGDYDEAIRCSHRSLEIKKNEPGYLDTLGRCYYAKRDLENAIKYQREAVRLDPHAGAIRRQLAFFEKEAEAAKKNPPAAGQP